MFKNIAQPGVAEALPPLVVIIILIFLAGIIKVIVRRKQIVQVYGPGYLLGMFTVSAYVPFGGLWPLLAPLNKV